MFKIAVLFHALPLRGVDTIAPLCLLLLPPAPGRPAASGRLLLPLPAPAGVGVGVSWAPCDLVPARPRGELRCAAGLLLLGVHGCGLGRGEGDREGDGGLLFPGGRLLSSGRTGSGTGLTL